MPRMYEIGDVIAQEYAVTKVFTNGGMGVVYKVRHSSWQMDMAMKFPRSDLLQRDESKKLFVNECETWMDIGVHPNVVTCFYVKEIDNVPAILMEYVDGGSLADYIYSGRLYAGSPDRVLLRILDIGIQSARGLGYAHEKGYVHQDVKPANIMMSSSGIVKVSDFGLAKTKGVIPSSNADGGRGSVVASSGGYTPAYGSPEQILRCKLTRRTDVWSWATMILEMLHGGVFWRIGPEAPRALKKLWPWQIFSKHVRKSAELLDLVRECLNYDERLRPHNFEDIEQRLLEIFENVSGRKYQRAVPPAIYLSESTLCNRIASYAELEGDGSNYLSKVLEVRKKLRESSPWSIYGELNYAIYMLRKTSRRIRPTRDLIENQLQNAYDHRTKALIVDMLLGLGYTSPEDPIYKKICEDDMELLRKIRSRHEHVRSRLSKVFENAQVRHKDACEGDRGLRYSRHDAGMEIGPVASEHGKCSVTVFLPDNGDVASSYVPVVVKVRIGEREYSHTDSIRCEYQIKFITVDDDARKISLWLDASSGLFQKVIGFNDGVFVSYREDFELQPDWGCPNYVFESGDARKMMLVYGSSSSGRCRCCLWYSDKPTPGDGRNVVDLDLAQYGLASPLEVSPNYEYRMDDKTAYSLIDVLSDVFGNGSVPFIIMTPENSCGEIKRTTLGLRLIESARLALQSDDDGVVASRLSECIMLGVLPDDALLDRRHSFVIRSKEASLFRVWPEGSYTEYWDNDLWLWLTAGVDGGVNISRMGLFKIGDGDFGEKVVIVASLANGDRIGFRCRESNGIEVVALCRFAQVYDKIEHTEVIKWRLNVRWEYVLPVPQSCLLSPMRKWDMNEGFFVLLIEESLVVFNLDDGEIVRSISGIRGLDYVKLTSRLESGIGLVVACTGKVKAFDRRFDELSSTELVRIYANTRGRLCDVSDDGTSSLVDLGWCIQYRNAITGMVRMVYDCRLEGGGRYAVRAVISPCGRVAIITHIGHLMFFDLKSNRRIFDWRVSSNNVKDICIDRTGRRVFVLHGNNQLDKFQLFWETNEVNHEAR